MNDVLKNFGIFNDYQVEKITPRGLNLLEAYKITTPADTFFLKKIRNADFEQIEKSTHIKKYLKQQNFELLNEDFTTQDGKFLYKDEGSNYWALQKFIYGIQKKANSLNQQNIKSLAEVLSKLHKTDIPDFIGSELNYMEMFNGEQHTKLEDKIAFFGNTKYSKLVTKYWDTYQRVRAEITNNLDFNETNFLKSIIHRDLNKGNILFNEQTDLVSAIIDWDTVVKGNRIQDICYICSHYFLIVENSKINEFLSKKLIQEFINNYQKTTSLNPDEKKYFSVIADILKIRATRWWIKRYIEKFEIGIEEKFEKGFEKTITDWLKLRNQYLDMFNSIKL